MQTQSDSQLVIQIQQGDIRSFEVFVKRYQRRVWGFVGKRINDSALVEEVVQDTLFSFYRTIDRVDTSKSISTYLFAIARHKLIDRLRKEKKVLRLADEDSLEDDERLYDLVTKDEQKTRVGSAIQKLPVLHRRVIRLFYFNELSYEEISRTLKIPINTVRTLLRRAKEKLKQIL
ncbi:MAG: RNA polymerase sigma factor [Candidatus Gottesmanbacteria bacterium]